MEGELVGSAARQGGLSSHMVGLVGFRLTSHPCLEDRSLILVCYLCFLRKLTDGVAESSSLLGSRMFGVFGSEQESTGLVRECLELEEWYATSFTQALCSNDADRPGAHEIREAIHGSDKGKLLDECECRSDAVVVVRVEREIGW